MRAVVDKRADAAGRLARGRFDLDHVRAHIGHQARGKPRPIVGQIQDAQSGERAQLDHGAPAPGVVWIASIVARDDTRARWFNQYAARGGDEQASLRTASREKR